MSKNYAEVEIAEDADGTEILPDDSASKSSLASGLDRRRRSSLAVGWRSRSVVIQRLPVQEAMKNGNSKNYFNALRRVDFAPLAQNWTPQENEEFLTSHLLVSDKHFVSDSRFIVFIHLNTRSRPMPVTSIDIRHCPSPSIKLCLRSTSITHWNWNP